MSPAVEPGRVLDGRYRLDRLCRERPDGSLWEATDEVLGRPVAVRLVPNLTRQDVRRLTAAAARAGQVQDARWVRVLDVGSEAHDRRQLAWIVSEWVEGTPLAEVVRHQPLEPTAATRVALECAQAVAAAQQAGATHGQLHPDEVIVTGEGTPRLTGLELRDADDHGPDDTRAVAGLLYTALTGRWPLPGWHRLPPPNRGDGLHPRKERRGIRRDLDEITARGLAGGYPDAGALASALSTLPVSPRRTADDIAAGRELRRRWAWRIVPPVVVIALAAAAWTTGREIGKVPGQDQLPVSNVPQAGELGPHRLVWSTTPPTVREFDLPGHRPQDPGGVGLAVDGDPSTSWVSDTYRSSGPPSAQLAGVGLLLDLGQPRAVRTARLLLSTTGAGVQLRAGNQRPRHVSDLRLVAQATNARANLRLHLHPVVHARYWLVWITALPHSGAGYRLGVAEIALLR